AAARRAGAADALANLTASPPIKMTPGRLLWLARRDLARGWSASWHDHAVRPRIRGWTNPHGALPPETLPIHVVAGKNHSDMALWMLAGFFYHTARNWPVVLHDDGTLDPSQLETWQGRGLRLRVVGRLEADDITAPALRACPLLAGYRAAHPLGIKLVDVPHLLNGGRGMLLDADIAFFARPAEILDWADGHDVRASWFNADVGEASNVPPDVALAKFGVTLWRRVNSGLCLLGQDVMDPDFCEAVLREGTILRGHVWRVEQTLFALNASRAGRGGLLPGSYEVSLDKHAGEGCVARHYVGQVRDRLWAEGVRRLAPLVLQR
ncbi:MAG: hypothetical protein ABII82_04350, partial [Verrucomicrobiota bacterium]